MGKSARIGLLLLASASLLSVMIDYAIIELREAESSPIQQ